jgi:HK97 family phage portal protein
MSAQMGVYLRDNGALEYNYRNANGTYTVYNDSEIWHIKLFGNSIVGMSPLAYARQSLGISLATENRVGKLAANGGKSTGILTVDRVLTKEQRQAIRENMKEIASGDSDSLKVLEADMKFQQISLSPNDLEMLGNRRFNVEDIARFMGVPSVLINDTAASTTWGSGIHEIIKGFYKVNLTPYLERIESSMQRWIMPMGDWGKVEIEFNFDSLLRADPKERAERDSIRINSAQITPNESRNAEGLLDKEGGDKLFINGALVPVDELTIENQGVQNENN